MLLNKTHYTNCQKLFNTHIASCVQSFLSVAHRAGHISHLRRSTLVSSQGIEKDHFCLMRREILKLRTLRQLQSTTCVEAHFSLHDKCSVASSRKSRQDTNTTPRTALQPPPPASRKQHSAFIWRKLLRT